MESKADVNAKDNQCDPFLHGRMKMAALLFDYFGRFDSLVLAVDGLRCSIFLVMVTLRHVDFCWSPKLT